MQSCAPRIAVSKPVSAVAPFFDESLNPGVSSAPSALGDPSHGWLISPSTGAVSKRDEVESKVERGCLQDLSLLHDQPQTERKRAEDTSSVGRYGVWFGYTVCRRTEEQHCGTNRALPAVKSTWVKRKLLEEQFKG